MSELIERLQTRKDELLAEAARKAVRASLGEEEIDRRANALAAKEPALTADIQKLGDLVTDRYSVVLGRDENGTYYAEPITIAPELIGFDYTYREMDSDREQLLERRSLNLEGSSLEATTVLRIVGGKASWVGGRQARMSTVIKPDALALEEAEAVYTVAEQTLKEVWQAVRDEALNPDLAARATELQV